MAETLDLAHQLRLHLDSLRAAGVLFVPRGTAVALPPPVVPVEEVDPRDARRHALDVLRAEASCSARACNRCSAPGRWTRR
jgi:uracil-DNA glycosylase